MAKPKNAIEPEPVVTLRSLLLDQLQVIADHLPEGRNVQAWYDDGAAFEELVGDIENDVDREEVSIAFGYLRGAHEALDVTMSEMFDGEDISMSEIKPS